MDTPQSLTVKRVPLASIHLDPANVRLHDERNLEAIKGSLARFGQQKPIVVDHQGTIRAGNGTYAAAKALGWTEITVVETDLEGVEATAYSIADNRTSDLSEFDEPALARLLKELQADGALDSAGYTEGELDELVAGLVNEVSEVTEDEVPGLPDAATTQRGDVWVIGRHRLMCGDSASSTDLDRLLAGAPIHLLNTDPPYNVRVEPRSNNAIAAGLSSFTTSHHQGLDLARHPGKAQATHERLRPKDRPLANDFVSDEDFARMLRAWFGNASRVLLPGRGFYIWGGFSNVANYPSALTESGLYFSQAIIWVKEHPVLTRKDFMTGHEWCQPGPTQVLTPDGPVPISSLRDGDRVISFRRNASVLTSRRGSIPVQKTARRYAGPLVRVVAGGRESYCTPGHLWSVRIASPARELWCVYLMRRGDWWRIGKSKLLSTWGFGVKHRIKTEDGDAAWILSVHGSNVEATIAEQVAQVKYGVPTTTWSESYQSRRTLSDVARLYEALDLRAMHASALRALEDHGRDILYPFLDRAALRGKVGARVSFSTRACNLIPGVMLVPVAVSERGRTPWLPIEQADREPFDGVVHSLAVPGPEHYVADGLVTHNCFHGWKEGAAHQFYGPANVVDVWSVKKLHHSAMVHLTEKPVELAARAIAYSSREGEHVLDLFGGSGSTMAAAEQTGRRAFLMELDALYCDVIVERIQKLAGEPAVLEGSGETFEAVKAQRA